MNMQSIRNSQPASKKGAPGGQSQVMGGGQRSSVTSSPVMGPQSSPHNLPYQGPLVMTPVFQLGNTPRRNSRGMSNTRPDSHDKAAIALDPDQYNPDGSLRTVHRMPGFDQSYAQAMRARYIRHSETLDREEELSVKEIFGHKK